MKSLVLAVALLVSACLVEGDSYIPGKQYDYEYVARVVSAIPNIQQKWSGLAIKSRLVVQPGIGHLVLKLEDVLVEILNEQVFAFRGRQADYRPRLEYADLLSKPFKVDYEDGIVGIVHVNRNETEWVVNFKKAIASIFNVNLQQKKPMSNYEGRPVRSDPRAAYFRVMEDSINGECETSYTFKTVPITSNRTRNTLKVLKNHNLENCLHRPRYRYSSLKSGHCFECEPEATKENLFQNYASTYYKLIGERHQFLIHRAFGSNQHIFTPYTTNGESIVAKSSQMLRLTKVDTVKTEISISKDVKPIVTLSYSMPQRVLFNDMINLKESHHMYSRYGHKARIEDVLTLLDDLIRHYDNITLTKALEKNLTSKYVEAVAQISTLDYEGIEELYRVFAKYDHRKTSFNQSPAKNLFWNILTDVGTNPAIMYGFNLIRTNERAAYTGSFLAKLPQVVKEPTELLLNELSGLCSHPEVVKCNKTQRACFLATAEFAGSHCRVETSIRNYTIPRVSCNEATRTKYFQYFSKKLNESRNFENQTIFVLSLGKLGDSRVLNLFKPIIRGETNHTLHVRAQAIWSLYGFVSQYPEQVLEIMTPLVFNETEDHELRIAAFTVSIAANPSVQYMYSIAKMLARTTDLHVQNYVYTTVKYISNSTHPCHRRIAEHAKIAFESLKASNVTPSFSPKYSWKYINGGFNEKYYTGGYTDITYIASNNSYVPRSGYLKFNDYIFGQSFNSLEIGFRSQGLDKVIDKIFGDSGLLFGAKSEAKNTINYAAKVLRDINRTLSIAPREYESILGQVYIQTYGQPIMFFFNESSIMDYFMGSSNYSNLYEYLSKGFSYHHQMYSLVVDSIDEIPTAAGLPLVLDAKLSTMVSLNVPNASFSFMPVPQGNLHTVMTQDLNLLVTMAVISPLDSLKLGAGYEHRRLISYAENATMKYEAAKFSYEIVPIEQDLFHMHFEPFTFIDSFSNPVGIPSESSYTPIGIHEFKQQHNTDFAHDYLGFGLNVNSTYYGYFQDRPAYLDFIQKNDFRSLLYYTWSIPTFRPFNFNVSFTNATVNPTTKFSVSLQAKKFDLTTREQYTPQFAVKDQEYESYVSSKGSRSPSTTSVVANIEFQGTKTRKFDAEFVSQVSRDELFRRFGAYFQHSGFVQDNGKVCFNTKIKRNELNPQKIMERKINDMNVDVDVDASLNWGSDCQSDKKIEASWKMTRTEEQKKYVEDLPKYKSHYDSLKYPYLTSLPHPAELGYNPYADMAYRCYALVAKGHMLNPQCMWYIHTVTQLRQVSGTVKYSKLPEYVANYTHIGLSWFNYKVFNHMDYYHSLDFKRPQNEIRFNANVSVHYPVFDMEIRSPFRNFFYERVPVYSYVPFSAYYPYTFSTTGHVEHYSTNWKNWKTSMCTLDSYIHTFDDKEYFAPLTNCYHIVAKDCSPNETFTVMIANTTDRVYTKEMKVQILTDVIEFVPVQSTIRVRRDGRPLTISIDEPYFNFITVRESKKLLYTVVKRTHGYVIEAPSIGLQVNFNGNVAVVQLSNFYKGKQCGLCGDMNGRLNYRQFRGPDNCLYPNTTEFTYSYALPTPDCKVPKYEKPEICKSAPVLKSDEGCSQQRTQLMQYRDSVKNQQTCFSTAPVLECLPGCQPSAYKTTKLFYHCLNAADTSTLRLAAERRNRVLQEVANKSPDKEKVVSHPAACIRST